MTYKDLDFSLNRLSLSFSHLHEHKFRHNFADIVNPLRTRYVYALLRLKAQIMFFYAAKIMYHCAQSLWMN